MDSHKLIVKFFAREPLAQHEFVPVFHSFIQQHAIPGHLLIDVADYQHVHHGPGILLAAHEGNFYTDEGEGRLGLLYQRKQPVAGANGLRGRLAAVFEAALRACERLESDPALAGRVKFRTDEVVLRINDRLAAPNTPETFTNVEPELRSFLAELFPGEKIGLEPRHSPLTLFEVRVRAGSNAPISDLLERLGALPNLATAPAGAPAPSR
jgi:hypothetical protein